jgi:hypothetical protein
MSKEQDAMRGSCMKFFFDQDANNIKKIVVGGLGSEDYQHGIIQKQCFLRTVCLPLPTVTGK